MYINFSFREENQVISVPVSRVWFEYASEPIANELHIQFADGDNYFVSINKEGRILLPHPYHNKTVSVSITQAAQGKVEEELIDLIKNKWYSPNK